MVDYNPSIQNIISTIDTKCKLDLQKIGRSALNVEYKPQRFSALIMRIREPRATALMFTSGKVVVAGTTNEPESKKACKRFVKILNKLGFKAVLTKFKIQNIVCTYNFGNDLSLEQIYIYCETFCCFEPELFPGLVFKIKKATLLIFSSGKVVITGLKDYNEVVSIFSDLYPIILKYKK